MLPTLVVGDRILVNKFSYQVLNSSPNPGDIIVFKAPHDPDKHYIKRVVAVEKNIVQIKDYKLYVNNKIVTSKNYTPYFS